MRKTNSRIALTSIYIFLLATGSTFPALAEMPDFKIKSSVKTELLYEDGMDLGTTNQKSTDSEVLEGKVTVSGNLTDHISMNVEARGVENYGAGGSIDSETGEAQGQEDFAELRQYWLQYKGFTQDLPLSLRVGRQRIREDRSLWWNRDLDAVSLIYDATLLKGFLTVGQDLTEYRTSGDSFNEDDQDVLRILGQTSWQWQPGHFFETRVAYQNDHSGLNHVGYNLEAGDRDDSDADLLWAGIRSAGKFGCGVCQGENSLGYRADLVYLTGSEDLELTGAGANGLRTVTGSTDQDVNAWAMDLGLDVPVPIAGAAPVLTFGYAFGSGDDNASDGEDNAFRQTGLDGNTSRMNGANSTSYNYGSVLRPDLSNIHILTAGVVFPVFKASDISGMYHYYRLSEDATSLATSGISAALNGTDKSLGQGLDVMLNVDVSQEFGIKRKYLDNIDFKTTLGAFKAGDAYGSADGETAYRGQFDLSFKF